ncbi:MULTISPECIES: hypothetical protein [Loigolactobacillus]|uniref:Uncharacterized protein n=1 Tax=Loigolactobacillus backii TaxID=375175 RepID=A0A192GZW0_9LACO|nr:MULTISPECIES: hypothetical protein [Loigolactobacillus]ANK58805.1 hypothetical protein AYR52_00125 [Loigolactobacillus backii]ANK61532.1 hypothetical protein AYR53_01385 [Loigolactobacillus backii]ANK63795.1 hypothetical protein AYR54_00120 [Loigolactobacillus backii]ANK66243.1 hypothetical protein AYR55_00120 [Loigolactobacillus backii]ANK69270.1 hypothetical protein AYR56_03330 [Loigolactobacillus backii]
MTPEIAKQQVLNLLQQVIQKQQLEQVEQYLSNELIVVLNGQNINYTRYLERLHHLAAAPKATINELVVHDCIFAEDEQAVTVHYIVKITTKLTQEDQIDVLSLWRFKDEQLIFCNEVAWPLTPVAERFQADQQFIRDYII